MLIFDYYKLFRFRTDGIINSNLHLLVSAKALVQQISCFPPIHFWELFDQCNLYDYSKLQEFHIKKQDVIDTITRHQEERREGYSVASLSLFGSVARDEAGPESDVDFLVGFNKSIGLFQFIEP